MWGREEIAELIEMCKAVDCWVVVDQVYHEFLHDSAGEQFVGVRECLCL